MTFYRDDYDFDLEQQARAETRAAFGALDTAQNSAYAAISSPHQPESIMPSLFIDTPLFANAPVAQPAPAPAPTQRHFFRCNTCCFVFALELPASPSGLYTRHNVALPDGLTCDCGATRFEHMGRVSADRLVHEGVRCACDMRCTHARGPDCNCQCNGANHGTHAVVRYRIDNGAAIIPPQPDLAQRRANVADEQQAIMAARFRLNGGDAALERFEAGQWIADRAAWTRVFYGKKAINDAMTLKTHAARMRKLERVGR